MEIIPLSKQHIEDAAVLVSVRYRAERKYNRSLPPAFEDPASIAPRLQDYANNRAGVAAVRDGRLAGFLLGLLVLNIGRRLAWVPDWGHAADSNNSREIYRALYAELAPRWVNDGYFTHAITVFSHEQTVSDAWFSLGFGQTTVDAFRDLSPAEGPAADVEIHRATSLDIDPVIDLVVALRRHLASAPAFIPLITHRERQWTQQWLADSNNAMWLAYYDSEPVALMGFQPSGSNARVMPVSDKNTVAFNRAFTREDLRSRGIGTALLNHALEWARTAGYTNCSVDYESTNIAGSRFWEAKGFKPVCYSLVRHIDERIAWAHRDRNVADILNEM